MLIKALQDNSLHEAILLKTMMHNKLLFCVPVIQFCHKEKLDENI